MKIPASFWKLLLGAGTADLPPKPKKKRKGKK